MNVPWSVLRLQRASNLCRAWFTVTVPTWCLTHSRCPAEALSCASWWVYTRKPKNEKDTITAQFIASTRFYIVDMEANSDVHWQDEIWQESQGSCCFTEYYSGIILGVIIAPKYGWNWLLYARKNEIKLSTTQLHMELQVWWQRWPCIQKPSAEESADAKLFRNLDCSEGKV